MQAIPARATLRRALVPALLVLGAATGFAAPPSGGAGQDEAAAAAPEAPALPPASELVDDPLQQQLIEAGRTSIMGERHIEVITGHFPKRLTGSPGLDLAQGWLIMAFEDFGLAARKEEWGSVPVGFERDLSSGRVVAPEERELVFTTPCWSPGTVDAVRGPALLEPATLEELEERAAEFEGAWMLRNPDVGRRARAQFTAAYEDLGIAGTIQPGARDGRIVTGGSMRIDWDDLPTLVRVTIVYDDFKAIRDQVEGGEAVELEFDVRNQFLHGPIPQYNVIAEIEGSEFPDEYVIVQGHMDAWDGAQGACDNGTGMATTMEAARLIQEVGIVPRRTIRFVFYTGEEQGLLGSRGYVERHIDELERVSIVLNHDNGTNYLKGISATEAMVEDFEHVFAPIQRLDPERPFEIRQVPGLRPGPSDHAPFVEAGVPAFHWDQSNSGYRRLHHTQHDTLEEVNHDDQRHSSLVVALAAVRFANLDHLVDRSYMRQPEPRRMGVFLGGDAGTELERVVAGGRAAAAGWKEGDRIVTIDGVEIDARDAVVAELQKGGPKKVVVLEREGELVETTLDYSEDPLEAERQAWREREEARAAEPGSDEGEAPAPSGG